MALITRPDEVYLFNTYFPIVGPVKKELASTWPQKQVTGDYTKDSERFVSSVTWSNAKGGIGLKQMKESKPEDAMRSWWSTCEGEFDGHLLMPPLPVLAGTNGNPTTNLDPVTDMFEFGGSQYAVFGNDVYLWTESTTSWGSSLHTLAGTPTSIVISGGYVFFAVGTDFERFDGTNWTTGLALVGVAVPSRYFLRWDAKLLVVSNTGLLSSSVDDGATWTANAQSDLPAGSFNGLVLYPNSTNTVFPALGTKYGLFFLDFDGAKWMETLISFPKHDYMCKGMAMWRDDLYVSAGLRVFQYPTLTSEVKVNPNAGLDRDWGLPAAYRGNIIKLIPEINHMYALMDATNEGVKDEFNNSPLGWDASFYNDEGFSGIFRFNGLGWQPIVFGAETNAPITCGMVSTADDNYRLWYGLNRKVYYITLNRDLQNPLELPDHAFATYAEHFYPIFDADNAVVQKRAVGVSIQVDGADHATVWVDGVPIYSGTVYVKVYYNIDETLFKGDTLWTLLTSTTFTNGQIYTAGTWDLPLTSAFKNIQFKVLCYVTSGDSSDTPDVRFLRLDYMKVPDTRYQYSFVADCRKDYRHVKAATLSDNLESAKENSALGTFMYRSINGVTETKNVTVVNIKGSDETGKVKRGMYQVTVLAP